MLEKFVYRYCIFIWGSVNCTTGYNFVFKVNIYENRFENFFIHNTKIRESVKYEIFFMYMATPPFYVVNGGWINICNYLVFDVVLLC